MSVIESIIRVLSPSLALKRQQALTMIEAVRDYDGAARGKRGKQWRAPTTTANQETRKALRTLRDRSRDLVRNNTYGKRAVQAIANNVVGTGIVPSITGITEQQERNIMGEWRKFAGKITCDYDGQHNLNGIQKLAMRTVVESGECLILRRRTGPVKLQLQVLEPEFIDQGKDNIVTEGGGYIIQGIEFDKDGKRSHIWVYDRHPAEFAATSRPIPIEDCAHIYLVERPGQVRGVPWLSAAMTRLRDLDGYEDAQLMRQKIASLYAAFITKNDPNAAFGNAQEAEEVESLYPGAVEYLAPGESITFASPPPATDYDNYVRRVLQGIATGIGMTYESLTGDLSNVNFSSGRMGWLEFQRNVQEWQSQMLVPMLMEPVWGWFIQSLSLRSTIPSTIEVGWTMPRREMIDPSKEVKALSDMVRNGFMSWSEAIRTLGGDPDDVATELAANYKLWDANGLKLQVDPRWDAGKSAEVANVESDAVAQNGEEATDIARFESLKAKFDSYGVAVRSGSITPSIEDEIAFREVAGLPLMSNAVRQAWADDGGYRRPITLAAKGDSAVALPVNEPEQE